MKEVPACVHIVSDRKEAQRVAGLLMTLYRDQVYGADTEASAHHTFAQATIVCLCPYVQYTAHNSKHSG